MKTIILILLLLFCTATQARMVDVVRTVTGFGANYRDALNAALLEAVQQVRGLEIGTEKNLHTVMKQVATAHSATTTATMGVKQDIYSKSHGWVKSYKITEVVKPKTEGSGWKVTIRVTVPHFQSDVIPNDIRKTLAVAPFHITQSSYNIDGDIVPGAAVSRRLRDSLLSHFTEARRFAVVNRAYGKEMASELALLKSDLTSTQEASRLGQVVGADFMVVGTIQHIGSPSKKRAFYGADFNKGLLRAVVSYQVVEVASQRVAWAKVIHTDIRPNSNFETYELFDKMARKIASGTTNVIYPIRIMDVVSDKQIYLSQGGLSVKVDDLLAVKGKGRKVKDPDTGRPVIVSGPRVATIKVTTVEPKYSVAELVDGDSSLFGARSVVEQLSKSAKHQPSAPLSPGSSAAPIQWE